MLVCLFLLFVNFKNTEVQTRTSGFSKDFQLDLALRADPIILMGCTLSMAGRSRASFSFRWYSASASCNRNKTITILFLCKSTFDNSLEDKDTVRRKRGEFQKFGTSWCTCIGLEKEEGTILLRSNRNRFGNRDGQIQHTRPSFPFT